MKKISWLLIVILAVACDQDEPDPVVDNPASPVDITAFLGEYRGVRSIERSIACSQNFLPDYPCETLVQDQVLLVTEGPSESTIDVLGYDVHIDKDGKFLCCPDLQNGRPIEVTIQNDTIKTVRELRVKQGFFDVERFIGVKGAKSPLKTGTVGFRSASSEELENISGRAFIYLDIEGAKFGASIIIDILTSTADPRGYTIYGGYLGTEGIMASDNKIVLNVLSNVASGAVGLYLWDDLVPTPSRNIQFRISDESVGVNVSEKRNHSFTIVEDDM